MRIDLTQKEAFEYRHNSATEADIQRMISEIGLDHLDQLIDQTIPASIRMKHKLKLPEAKTERVFLDDFKKMMGKNKRFKNYIGLGYYGTHTPTVIQRNILENPGWYTAYTPYQAEIAQGRLEALANFQTLVMDLSGMDLANASLLDEGTAVAEAMSVMAGVTKGKKKNAKKLFVDQRLFPQSLEVLKTRAIPMGVDLVIDDLDSLDLSDPELYGLILQNPDGNGELHDFTHLIQSAHEQEVLVTMVVDIMSLVVVKSPGAMGADVVVGSSQRFGIPMGYGGPHAAFFATREAFKRQIPGRIIGVSIDAQGKKGYRMALQTREQHIKRERATSNICTAQVLLAVMAGMYAVYHGPEGLKRIASTIHGQAVALAEALHKLGYEEKNKVFFDTLKIAVRDPLSLRKQAEAAEINLRYFEDGHVGISIDETTTTKDLEMVVVLFAKHLDEQKAPALPEDVHAIIPDDWQRKLALLAHPVFHSMHSEHEMLRYIKRLENKDLSLVHSMISLGSCTMKLNATTEMIPLSWPDVGALHPFVPVEQAAGYSEMFQELKSWLREVTGFAAISLQPNSGAQGEYAGLMVIRAYHLHRGETHRKVALIPSSAHGTNPASAVMAGMDVVIVACDDKGNIDLHDLKNKAEKHKDDLAALMVTYPSTHGVFEEEIIEICDIIHQYGGQVYMDGANMNAQVGLTSPAIIGADVCHLNLHKTFCIPHGGGGPGMGPIGVAEHLKDFLPGHALVKTGGEKAITAVSAAPYGSSSILSISYAYMALMGGEGLTQATKLAILNANYIKSRLTGHFPILYTGKKGHAAHEMIIDCRVFKKVGVEVEDIAKRLMDYGFHAPTVSFPVPGTMMIEPTESESIAELDRFCEALIQVRREIKEIEEGKADQSNNVLKNAPHPQYLLMADEWNYPYSRSKAAYPLDYLRINKFWPSIARIDSAYGDRNLVCSCIPVEEYMQHSEPLLESTEGVS